MQNTGQGSEKRSYRVILLLVVGLAAFSSAMKELNQVHELTLETSSLLAQWTDRLVPTEKTISVETCETNQVNIPLPPLPVVPTSPLRPAPVAEPDDMDCPATETMEAVPAPPTPARVPATPFSKPRRMAPPLHDPAEVRVWLSTDDLIEKGSVDKNIRDAFETDPSLKALKAKSRRHIFITPDGKDVILKTLSRSINLRSAS